MTLRGESDPRQVAFYKLFGITHRSKFVLGAQGLQRIAQGTELPAGPSMFAGLRDAYVAFSGDLNFDYVGKNRVAQAGTWDFPAALANVLSALLIKNYVVDYRYTDLVAEMTSAENFRTQQRSRLRYIEDLPDVVDDATYDEIPNHGDEGYTLAINQKGGTITITRRMIMNDQVGLVQQLTEQLGQAAMRTLAKRAWNKVINNDVYGVDGLALFHATHGNLGSAALSVTTLNAARAAMFAQTIPGSTERLGLSGPFLLVIPVELEATALTINNCAFVPGTTDGSGNPWYHKFGPDGERIFANSLLTDTNDWYLFDLSGKAGILEIAFLLGKQQPQIITSHPDTDSGLTQDRIVLKVRHEYECAIRDYRGAYKAVVI
jgi:hypothetical protein